MDKSLYNTPSEWNNLRKPINRISWDELFLSIAFKVAERSHDAQTHCGAVIVNGKDIIATGYNGFMRNIDDSVLPNMRPAKYDWMIHAEHNAILACARQGKSTLGTIMYVTGHPCQYCCQYIQQAGIQEVVWGNHQTNMQNDPKKRQMEKLIKALVRKDLKFRNVDFPSEEWVQPDHGPH